MRNRKRLCNQFQRFGIETITKLGKILPLKKWLLSVQKYYNRGWFNRDAFHICIKLYPAVFCVNKKNVKNFGGYWLKQYFSN